jgi:hypothetical protein
MSFVSNLAHSLVIEWKMSTILTKNKMNGIKKIDSFTKMFCPIQIGRTRPKLAGQIAEQTASRTE